MDRGLTDLASLRVGAVDPLSCDLCLEKTTSPLYVVRATYRTAHVCADCFGAANRESAATLRHLNAQLDEAIKRAVAAEHALNTLLPVARLAALWHGLRDPDWSEVAIDVSALCAALDELGETRSCEECGRAFTFSETECGCSEREETHG